jgi:hypothetical protein
MDLIIKFLPLAVVLLAIVVIWRSTIRKNRQFPERTTRRGFRGWLLVLAIVQWIILLRTVGDIVTGLPDYDEHWSNSVARHGIVVEAGITVGAFLFFAYATVMMTLKRRIFPALFRIELVLLVLLPWLSAILVTLVMGTALNDVPLDNAVAQSVVTILGAVIWFLYSLQSTRMRNTFDPQARDFPARS